MTQPAPTRTVSWTITVLHALLVLPSLGFAGIGTLIWLNWHDRQPPATAGTAATLIISALLSAALHALITIALGLHATGSPAGAPLTSLARRLAAVRVAVLLLAEVVVITATGPADALATLPLICLIMALFDALITWWSGSRATRWTTRTP